VLTGDKRYVERSLELARKAVGLTFPNPLVGAVLVADGKIVGEGSHRGVGNPHAEIEAINQAGEKTRGATLYLNLEPCCHFGKTPPCTDAILEAGISRVVFSIYDPDERVRGRGAGILRAKGVSTTVGVLSGEALELNLPYIHRNLTGKPFIVLKLASTINGYLTAGDRRWLTGEKARQYVHYLRAWTEAIGIGIGTLESDAPILDRRLFGKNLPPPIRMVFDTSLRFPSDHSWLVRGEKVIIYCLQGSSIEKMGKLEKAGAEVVILSRGEGGIDLSAWIDDMAQRGLTSVLIEGGGEVSTSIIRSGLFDRLVLFYVPLISGTKGVSWYQDAGPPPWLSERGLLPANLEMMEGDLMMVYDSQQMERYIDVVTEGKDCLQV